MSLYFKHFKCNAVKLSRRNTNVYTIRETFLPRNILRLKYVYVYTILLVS